MTARRAVALLVALVASLWLCASAGADVFSAAALLSTSPFEQAEYAHSPVIAEDGDWVVFEGSVGGVRGIWRRAVNPSDPSQAAELEQVAGGEAALPSVSANGQYISFTSREGASLPQISDGQLHAPAPLEHPGVYVRNMAIPFDQPCPHAQPHEQCAFELASAKNGSTESLAYEYTGEPSKIEAEEIEDGAIAASRTAISASGRKVAFVTTAISDLAGPATPPFEVAVRDLETDETQLVSVAYDAGTGRPAVNPETGGPVPVPEVGGFGAAYHVGFAFTGEIAKFGVDTLPGASISGNGTTVAWLAQQPTDQVKPLLPGEQDVAIASPYAEPLWRRITDGPESPTLRVAGGPDPENPACASDPQPLSAAPSPDEPCQGPFQTQVNSIYGDFRELGFVDPTPVLDYEGDAVAFIASAPLVGSGRTFEESEPDDAYWIETGQPSAAAALHPLSTAGLNRTATSARIEDVAISSDGGQVAFTTERIAFPRSEPAFISAPAATPGLNEIYEADIDDDTLTRASRGYEGGLPEQPHRSDFEVEDAYSEYAGAHSPSFSRGGALLAFSSTASNLVYGDGNTPPLLNESEYLDGADAFVVKRESFTPEPSEQIISPPPPNPEPKPPWTFSVSAQPLTNGTVRVTVRLPGSGTLRARAISSLVIAHTSSKHRKAVSRVVASSTRSASSRTVTLTLTLSSAYRALAARGGGLRASVLVTFSSPGEKTLSRTITVTFKRRIARSHRSRGRAR